MIIEVVCFDMDGTLIRGTDSVEYLCGLNNKTKELQEIQARENSGEISWIEADYHKVKLIAGLSLDAIEGKFSQGMRLIRNIEKVLEYLHERNIKAVLITSGAIQVAEIMGKRFAFDGVFGGEYEVKDGKFTGEITTHMGEGGKLRHLSDFCKKANIPLYNCVAVGDSDSDIALFRECGKSIAINYSEVLQGKASAYFNTDDLYDIIAILGRWLDE
ncbi:MAG: HAD family phosphatase [Candidatus Zixiibacteriota bacterium]